uniref:Uncharacterized protein n=2 Tax=Sphaerodactylus townsendi TaxID=933632 RepID=A0ACB8EYS9_9SAUR
MLSALSRTVAEATSRTEPLATFLPREDATKNVGYELSISAMQPPFVPTEPAEIDLPTTFHLEPSKSAGQKMRMDISPSLATSPGSPDVSTLDKNMTQPQALLEDSLTPVKHGLGKSSTFLPTGSQRRLVDGGLTLQGPRTSEIPRALGLLREAQASYLVSSQQQPLSEEPVTTQQPDFASSPHGEAAGHKAVGLPRAEGPALLTPPQSHATSSQFLLSSDTLSSGTPPQSAVPGDASQGDQPRPAFLSWFAPSSQPVLSDEADKRLQESMHFALQRGNGLQVRIQPSSFKVSQIAAALGDPPSVSKGQETTPEMSVPTQEQPQLPTLIATVEGEAQGIALRTSPLGEATSPHADSTMPHGVASSHIQPLLPVTPGAARHVTQAISEILLPSTFSPLVHGLRASLRTSVLPLAESASSVSASAPVPTQPPTPGLSASVRLGTHASFHALPQRESEHLSTGTATSVPTELPARGSSASSYAGPRLSDATEPTPSTPRPAGLSTLVLSERQGRAFGVILQTEHQTFSARDRPTVAERNVPSPLETGAPAAGLNVPATAACAHPTPNLSADVSRPFYAKTQPLPTGDSTKLQPATPYGHPPGPQVPVLEGTLPTHFKSQKPCDSASSVKDSHFSVLPVYAQANLNKKEAPAEGSLPVSTEASFSIPPRARAPWVLPVHAQPLHHLPHVSAQLGTTLLAHVGTQTPNTPPSSSVQLLGNLGMQPSSTSVFVQTELWPEAVPLSAEAAAPNSKAPTPVQPSQQLPVTLVLPGTHHTTAKEGAGQSSPQSSPKAASRDSPPWPGVFAARAPQRREGRGQRSAAPSLVSPSSQTIHHKNVDLPIPSPMRLAHPFPGLGTTPMLVGAEVQDLMQDSQGYIRNLLNQSDVAVDGNLDSAVASSYLGISSSLQSFSFLIQSAENMICLQPMQNTTPPSGEPNVTGLGVPSFPGMLIPSAFLGLSHPGASHLIHMSPSSIVLVKPTFVFLPADDPEDLVLRSAEEKKEHPDRHSFTKAAVLRLVASGYGPRAESHSTSKHSTRANVLPTDGKGSSESVLGSLPEFTTGASGVTSTSLKANLFRDELRQVATPRTEPIGSRDQGEGFLSSTLDPSKSETNHRISLSVEHHGPAMLPMMAPVHQRHKMSPSTMKVLNSPPRATSLHSVMEHSASPMLARMSRSEPQLSTTPAGHVEDSHPGSMTPITSSSKNFEEPLRASSAGNMDRPLEVVKHLTPLRVALRSFLTSKVFRKHPSEIQYPPGTVSGFLTFSTVKNLTKHAAVSYAYSEAAPALPHPAETSSYFMASALANVSQSHRSSPIPLRASETPRTSTSPTPFLEYIQAHTTLSKKQLEGINLQVRSRPPVSVSSQGFTNSYFATSALKDSQALIGRGPLTSTEEQTNAKISDRETGKNVRHPETHHLEEATHFMPTMLGTDPAFLVSPKFISASASSGGNVGSTGFQKEIPKFPLTTPHPLPPSATRKDMTASPIGGTAPPLEMPHSDLQSLSEIGANDQAIFFSPLIAKEEVIQHGRWQKAGAAPPFSTSSRLHPQPTNIEGDHQDRTRLLNYGQIRDSGSFIPRSGTTFSSLGSSAVAKIPASQVTTLPSGVPSDGPVDKVPNQTSHLQSLPLDLSETTRSLHTQVLLTLEGLLDTSEGTAEGDFVLETTSTAEFAESYLHTVGEPATVVMNATKVMDITEETEKDPLAVLQQSGSNSSLLDRKVHHRRPTRSDFVLLDGFAIVSDDACGSGNYTTEMNLYRTTGRPPSRTESFLARIVLQSNCSRPTLMVQSCCVTHTAWPIGPDAACCLFSRTPLGCKYMQLHQNSNPQAASLTIQPFQLLNCSMAYLHCELSVCLSNHASCDQSCSEDRETRSQAGQPSGQSTYQTLHNLISFGPIQKAQPEFPSEAAAESELAMLCPVLLGSLAGVVILLGISVFIWFYQRHKIRMAEKLEGEGLCTP